MVREQQVVYTVPITMIMSRCWLFGWLNNWFNKKHLKNVGPIHHREPPHAHSPDVASGTVARRLYASMSTTTSTTTTTTTRDRGDRYGPMEWAQLQKLLDLCTSKCFLKESKDGWETLCSLYRLYIDRSSGTVPPAVAADSRHGIQPETIALCRTCVRSYVQRPAAGVRQITIITLSITVHNPAGCWISFPGIKSPPATRFL